MSKIPEFLSQTGVMMPDGTQNIKITKQCLSLEPRCCDLRMNVLFVFLVSILKGNEQVVCLLKFDKLKYIS